MFQKSKFINFVFKYIISISIIFLLIYSTLFSFPNNNSFKINQTLPPEVKDTIYVYDTIVQFDTIYIYETVYDTVFIFDTINYSDIINDSLKTSIVDSTSFDTINNRKFQINLEFKLPEFKYKFKFYAGGDIGFSYFHKITSWNENVTSEYKNLYRKSSKYSFGITSGFNIMTNYQNFEVQTGINYNQYLEKFDFFHQKLNIDTLKYFSFFQNNFYKVDTIFYLDLDELLHGDTVWLPIFDTTFTYFRDSTLITEYDSIFNNVEKKSLNLYSYIEIPLIFGYQFNKRKYSITPKAGIIFGINIHRKGYNFGFFNENYFISNIKTNNYPKINLSFYGSVNLRYKIRRNLFLYSEPSFSFNLNKAYSNQYNKTRFLRCEVKFGFYYLL